MYLLQSVLEDPLLGPEVQQHDPRLEAKLVRVMVQASLLQAGYDPSLSHEAILELIAQRKAAEDRVRPVLAALQKYHDLPPVSARIRLSTLYP